MKITPAPMTPSHAQRFAALKRELLHLDYFCKGTVLKRMMKCGNPSCPCHHNPGKRHGPYWECTYKVENKTVNLKLYPETVPLYRTAIREYRKLKSILEGMERLSRAALARSAHDKLKADR
jgi:hypothetical protein